MKINKEQFKNLAFIILLALIVFTPLGFYPRVLISRIFSFSPSVIAEKEQKHLSNYQWQLYDLDRNTFDLKDLSGEVILLNSWATWCPPCVAEMPSFQKLYLDYNDKIAFVFIASDEKESVREFLAKKEYTLPVYFANSKAPLLLASERIPTTYVIDSEGKIIIEKTGSADWNSRTTRELLDKLIQEK